MKIKPFLAPFSFLVIWACSPRSTAETKGTLPRYEIAQKNDTINYLDKEARKQGHWIVYEVSESRNNLGINTAPPDSVSQQTTIDINCFGRIKREEGYYKDDKKTGLWLTYSNDGSVKDSLVYN